MPPSLALLLCFVGVGWLFYQDRKWRPMTSRALWIAFVWIAIIGSRPISFWFGGGLVVASPDDYVDGSPVDRSFFLILLGMGVLALWRRKIDWRRLVEEHRWLLIFFLYALLSVLWADYTFVGFKRWIKDVGNVIMVLIILTDRNAFQATRAVFARCAYLAIPFSIVFIKYFPHLGRYYNRWTWEPAHCGVTMEKNALGCVALVCGIFLVWDLLQVRGEPAGRQRRVKTVCLVVLLAMVAWLIDTAGSSTAQASLTLGIAVLLVLEHPRTRPCIRHMGLYGALMTGFLALFSYVPAVRAALVGMLGRDLTLTGRTDLWATLLEVPINPVFGTGYQSFWLGERAVGIWAKYYFHPNQAHNGYLETYLNGGAIGVVLLLILLIAIGRRLKERVLQGDRLSRLQLAFFLVALIYNWTEAMFNRMSPAWIILLLASLGQMRPAATTATTTPPPTLRSGVINLTRRRPRLVLGGTSAPAAGLVGRRP